MLVRTKFLNEFFTSNVDSGTVTAIEKSSDPSGWKETNIGVGKAVEGIDILPDDKEVWVANAGDLIPPEAMERLFTPFSRGEVRPNQQGLGLGLYFAAEIARAHGGTLSVSSTQDETRFTFQMPLG